MIFSLLILPVWAGYQFTYTLNKNFSTKERFLIGAIAGYPLFSYLVFLLAWFLGFNFLSVIVALTVFLIAGFWKSFATHTWISDLAESMKSTRLMFTKLSGWLTSVFVIAIFLLIARLASQIAIVKPDGLYTGFLNNFGDITLHIAHITSFAFGQNIPPENPIFAGMPLGYPFLANLFGAIFHQAGIPLSTVLNAQALLFITLTLAAAAMYFYHLSEKNRLAMWLGLLLLMFNGGFGFFHIIQNHWPNVLGVLKALLPPPYDLTSNVPGLEYHWMNFFSALAIPQRSLMFGFPIALLVICLLWWGINSKKKEEFIWAGILTGILPFCHAHSFFSVFILSFFFSMIFRTRQWLYFYVPAICLSAPQMMYLISFHGTIDQALKFQFGWMAKGENVFRFWFRNLGAFSLLYPLSILLSDIPKTNRKFILCAFSLFILGNVILFAPWDWDNIKIFFVWYVVSLPLVATLLTRGLDTKKPLVLGFTLLVIFITILSGALTVYWLAMPGRTSYLEYTHEEITLAKAIRKLSPPHSYFLASPSHIQVPFLSGRMLMLGHTGWLWSHGIDFTEREEEIKKYFSDPKRETAYLKKAGIDFVLFGPREKAYSGLKEMPKVNELKLLLRTKNYELYQHTAAH